MNVLSDLSKVR